MIGNIQEKILISRLRIKDKEAFGKLYDIYIDRIYRFIYFKVGKVEEAEDLTSQTFLKIWQYALEGKVKLSGSFQALLYKTARNLIIDYYRQYSGKNDYSIEKGIEIGQEITDESNDVGKLIDEEITKEKIEQKLRNLKSDYQEVIVLYYINELSIKEITEILDKKNSAIRVLLHRALKSLKKEL